MKKKVIVFCLLCLISLLFMSCVKEDNSIPEQFKQDKLWMAYKSEIEKLDKVERKISKKYKYPKESREYKDQKKIAVFAWEELERDRFYDFRKATISSESDSVKFQIILDAFSKINSSNTYVYETDLYNPYDGFYQELTIRGWKDDERVPVFAWKLLSSLTNIESGFSHSDLLLNDEIDNPIKIKIHGEVQNNEIIITSLEIRASEIFRNKTPNKGSIELVLEGEDAKYFLIEVSKFIENNGIHYV